MNEFTEVTNYPGDQEIETEALTAFLRASGLDYKEVTKLQPDGKIKYDFIRRIIIFPGRYDLLPAFDHHALLLRVARVSGNGSYALLSSVNPTRMDALRKGIYSPDIPKESTRKLAIDSVQVMHLERFFQTYTPGNDGTQTDNFEIERIEGSSRLRIRAQFPSTYAGIETHALYFNPVEKIELDEKSSFSATQHGGYSWGIRRTS